MKSKIYYLLFATCYLVIFLLLPITKIQLPTLAEIHTSNDWIGIYPVNEDDAPPFRDGGYTSFKYTNCSSSPGNPILSSTGCSFTAPSNPGLYHFRMQANSTFTPMDISGPFWVSFSATATPICVANTPYIRVSWPHIYGLEPAGSTQNLNDYFNIYRDGSITPLNSIPLRYNVAVNSHFDPAEAGTSHTYTVRANSCYNCTNTAGTGTAVSITTAATASVTAPTAANCSAFLKTTSGDVHSNEKIETTGGP